MTRNQQDDRVPELEGIRGLAILLVLIYHTVHWNPGRLPAPALHAIRRFTEMGWIGVDVFFVLSGFLITSILLRTREEKGYFKKFYARRFLRIFPLYYAVLTLLFLALPLLEPSETGAAHSAWAWYFFYIQNWGTAFNILPGTFSLAAMWSLAIEEQFYLFWPTVVYRLGSRALAVLSGLLVVFSLALRIFVVKYADPPLDHNSFTYFATITRFDSLILGALIAISFQSEWWKKVLKHVAVPVFLVGSGLTVSFAMRHPDSPLIDNYRMYTYGFTTIALAAGALIVMLGTYSPGNILRVAFRSGVPGFFGKYSYAIYLFHMPVILVCARIFVANAWSGAAAWVFFIALSIAISVLAALLSWNLLEKRMLALKRYFEYEPVQEEVETVAVK